MKNETVLETKEKQPAPEPETKTETKKTFTNWTVLEDARFIPAMVKCDGYKGDHPADLSCHTAFPPEAAAVIRHMESDHGGGWFKIKFRISDSKKSPLWRELQEAGVELQELWCPHCRQRVALDPWEMHAHLKTHNGAVRVNTEPQTLCMTLSFKRPGEQDLDELYNWDSTEK